MSLNSIFENGVVDYVRNLLVYEDLFKVDKFFLYRIGDFYYTSNCKNMIIGIKKDLHTKDDKSMLGDVFCYHDCRTMNHFKYVSSITDGKVRRQHTKSRGIYSFLMDKSLGTVLLWYGDNKIFMKQPIANGELYSLLSEIMTEEIVYRIFGGLVVLCNEQGVYYITVELFEYGNNSWCKVHSPYWSVCICLNKKKRSIEMLFGEYEKKLTYKDFEHNRKKDTLFRGLRIHT